MSRISYAQQFEDIILWRALKDVQDGAYIDIGANDPVADSVSMMFYERGWRGLHVEPMPSYAQRLRDMRPDEIVVEAAVGDGADTVTLFQIEGTGLTTAVAEYASRHEEDGRTTEPVEVPCVSLSYIFDRFNRRHVHWLKVDVEGMEESVLRSWEDHQTRPWVVVVEATIPNSPEPSFEAWEEQLFSRGYEFVYFDGLSRFYVHEDQKQLISAFGMPPNVFDHFVLSETSPFVGHVSARLSQVKDELSDSRGVVEHLTAKLSQLDRELSASKDLLEQLSDEVALRKVEVDNRTHENANLQQQLLEQKNNHTAELKHLQLTLENNHTAELKHLKLTLENNHTAELKRLQLTLDQAHSAEIRAKSGEIYRLSQHVSALKSEVTARQAHIESLRKSTSWQVTAPLRAVGLIVHNLTGGVKTLVRPAFEAALGMVRTLPILKKPLLAAAGLFPPARRKIDHFVSVRPRKSAHVMSRHQHALLRPATGPGTSSLMGNGRSKASSAGISLAEDSAKPGTPERLALIERRIAAELESIRNAKEL